MGHEVAGRWRTRRCAGLLLLVVALLVGCRESPPTTPRLQPPGKPSAVRLEAGNFVQLSGGGETCALRRDGSVLCWGHGAVPRPGPFIQLSAGLSHTCAIRTDGTVACWGDNGSGRATPLPGTFTQVSAAERHSCGIRTDGTLACWGDNTFGQLDAPAGTFTHVAAGGLHACALRTDGSIACWGRNDFDQASAPAGTFTQISANRYHTCALRTDHTIACWGGYDYHGAVPAEAIAPAGTFIQVSTGYMRTCAVRTDGTVACWGRNGEATPPAGPFTQVSAGGYYAGACALRTDGTVTCWGSDTGLPMSPTDTFTKVSVGLYHGCALRTDATVACWGSNYDGQATSPAGAYTQVSAGWEHTCALRTDGTMACWGRNDAGQATPRAGAFTQVSAGNNHTCAVRTDGTVTCWGDNQSGRATPPAGTFSQVSAGGYHTCALRTNSTVACWGSNTSGWAYSAIVGQATPPAGTFTQVSAGEFHSCGLRTDGTVTCWGDNYFGESASPSGTFTRVSAGLDHSCALRSDGTVACWGSNGHATPAAGPFTQISSGGTTCGLELDGSISCWADRVIAESPAVNHNPSVLLGGPYVADEGAPAALRLKGTDPAGDKLTYTWDLGDGTRGRGRTPPTSHVYADNGTYSILLTADDDKGGHASGTTTVTVSNVAPIVSAILAPVEPILVGTPVTARATYTDAGTADTHVASLHWEDGRVSKSPNGGPSDSVSFTHSYSTAGLYTLYLYVTDKDGGRAEQIFRYVAVYDPAGPYTTGSGSFTTVPSDCPRCGKAAQEADFTFDARFRPGMNTPDGSVRFWLPGTQFEFRSTSMAMLLANRSRVQFWGEGTLNGASGYTFRLTATPGGAGTGAIRMQIWEAGTNLIYDVQRHTGRNAVLARAIEGGQIAITQP